MRATRAIIHLDNFRRNIEAARNKAGPHPMICVPVKADAYGHGAVAMSRAALEAGAEYLAVAAVSEGAELRAAGITAPILLLSQALPEETPEIVSLELEPLVSDAEYIETAAACAGAAACTGAAGASTGARAAALAQGRRLKLHLKIDTGMGRMGCRPEEAAVLAADIASRKALALGGVATHLSVADSTESGDIAYTKEQLRRFREAVASIKDAGIEPGIIHAANSGALVYHDDAYFDMIRPGIFLYGYSPAGTGALSVNALSAEPVMELRSAVAAIKWVKKGEAVSYGRTWIAPEDTCIGVLPAGYADGLPRLLSNNHSVRIRGRAYPLVGRICMDQCMVNLGTGSDVKRWDEAMIFGPGFITACDIAQKVHTISYEITCGINKRVPRVYESGTGADAAPAASPA